MTQAKPSDPASLRRRIKERIVVENDCWMWQGANVQGYGRINVAGRCWRVHRLSYELHVGPIPDGLVLDHLCRNPPCCNPEHLEPVTQRVNVLRGEGAPAIARRTGRCARGHERSADNVAANGDCRQCARVRNQQREYIPHPRPSITAEERRERQREASRRHCLRKKASQQQAL